MEGYNPSANCTATCGKEKGWVPPPPLRYPKRNALADAWALTEDPCHPPGRCPPCCRPIPKYRLFRKFCDKETLEEIAKEKKRKEKEARLADWQQYYESQIPPPALDVIVLNQQNQPIEIERDCPPLGRWKEMKPKTNFAAGFFNKDDNKTFEELRREMCDPSYVSCNDVENADFNGLPQYPCRGVINYPCLKWVTRDEECRKCFKAACLDDPSSSYLTPERLLEWRNKQARWEAEKQMKEVNRQVEQEGQDPYRDCYKGACQSYRCSETEYCMFPNKRR